MIGVSRMNDVITIAMENDGRDRYCARNWPRTPSSGPGSAVK